MKIIKVLIKSIKTFFDDDPMTYAASLAFYTVVSLPGILLIAINTLSQVYEKEQVKNSVLEQLNEYLGPVTVNQAENILENATISYEGIIPQFIGWAVLIFSATTVFITLQTSINNIWKVKRDANSPILRMLLDRIWSFATIVSIGFVLLVSLVIDSLLSFVLRYLENNLTPTFSVVAILANILLSFLVTSVIFALIFKVLPDVKTQWRNIWIGALFSTFLFLIGKYMIGIYLNNAAIGNAYGASGSLVVFLSWVYYSSIIVLFGAKFTFEYTLMHEDELTSYEFTNFVKDRVIEKDSVSNKVLE